MASDDNFLSRWSRLKRASKAGPERPPGEDAREQAAPDAAPPGIPSPPAPVAQAPQPAEPPPLPPVESLTPESDFTPFMKPGVDPSLRRSALKTLFQDARFNIMDGLDVYIDDYSKPDPIPPDWLDRLNQLARLGDYQPPAAPEEPREQVAAHEKTEGGQAVANPAGDPPVDTSDASRPTGEGRESGSS